MVVHRFALVEVQPVEFSTVSAAELLATGVCGLQLPAVH
jgi:hypothetical protein